MGWDQSPGKIGRDDFRFAIQYDGKIGITESVDEIGSEDVLLMIDVFVEEVGDFYG